MNIVGDILREYKENGGGFLPTDSAERKATPICRGVVDYFPAALAEIARVSKAGNDQHNAGEPMHWARGKSTDHADCIVRHLIDRGKIDTDGQRHTAKLAWRALALLQEELEQRPTDENREDCYTAPEKHKSESVLDRLAPSKRT